MSLVRYIRRLRHALAATLLLAAGSFARGQSANTNSYYADIAWTPAYVSGQQILTPVPNAQITVCTYPATAVPCTNLATIYYGPTIGGGINPTNPTPTDQYGNFAIWAAPGYYQYTVTNSAGQSAGPYTIVLGSASTAGAASIPATTLLLKGSNVLGTALPAVPGTDYLLPGTLPNGTSATTQTLGDTTTKLATDAFVATAVTAGSSTSIPATNSLLAGSGVAGVASAVTAIPNGTTATTQSVADNTTKVATDAFVLANAASGSQRVVYASKIPGVTTGVAIIPGSSATSTTDSAAAINEAISGGNVDLEVDSGFALSTSLVLSSNTTIHCIAPQYGFIMQPASNASILINAHPAAPTTTSGTGGYVVSNITDTNLRITGCLLNMNAAQAVTGTVPHPGMTNPATGLFILGTFFAGVSNVTFDHNETYDPGVFNVFFTNATNIHVTDNYIHVPTPVTLGKSTDGVHFIGPDTFLWVQNNHIIAGDDSVAFNADDGNRPGSGDPNTAYATGGQWTPVKWGPITDFHEDNNTLDQCVYGGRLLSATELIDRGTITNLQGTCTDYIEQVSDPYTGLGVGNIGTIMLDNIQVDVGAQSAGFGAAIPVYAQTQSLQIRGLKYRNPGSTNPILKQTAGAIGILSLRDWDIYTPSSTITSAIDTTGGTIHNIAASGIAWDDPSANTGTVFAGSVVPSILTCSNYAGPNRLLPGSGYTPANENGDCFTNTYPALATVYVNTTFNEQTAGTLLATTTPATCTNGCTGTWTAAAGGPPSGQWAYSTNSATITGGCTSGGPDIFCPVYINAGTKNATIRVNVTTVGSLGIVFRWTDLSNFSVLLLNGGNSTCYDVVAGSTTSVGSGSGNGVGLYTIVMNNTAISVTTPSGSFSCTVSSSNTSNNVGLNSNIADPSVDTGVVSSFSVKSF